MRTYYLTTICLGICVLFFWLNISVGFWGEKIENNARLSRHQLPASQQTEAFDFLGLFFTSPFGDSCPWISVPIEEYTIIPPCYIPVNRTNRKKTPGPFCVFKRWREHDQKNQVVKWTLPPALSQHTTKKCFLIVELWGNYTLLASSVCMIELCSSLNCQCPWKTPPSLLCLLTRPQNYTARTQNRVFSYFLLFYICKQLLTNYKYFSNCLISPTYLLFTFSCVSPLEWWCENRLWNEKLEWG